MLGLYPQRLLPHNGTGQRLVAENVAVFPFGLGAEIYVLAQTGELQQHLSGGGSESSQKEDGGEVSHRYSPNNKDRLWFSVAARRTCGDQCLCGDW